MHMNCPRCDCRFTFTHYDVPHLCPGCKVAVLLPADALELRMLGVMSADAKAAYWHKRVIELKRRVKDRLRRAKDRLFILQIISIGLGLAFVMYLVLAAWIKVFTK